MTTAIVVTLWSRCSATTSRRGRCDAPHLCRLALPCALQFAMLLAIEFPDAAGDAAAASARWSCGWAAPAAARLYAGLTLAGFGALPLLAAARACPSRVAIAPLVLAPLAIWQAVRVARGGYGDSARWEASRSGRWRC